MIGYKPWAAYLFGFPLFLHGCLPSWKDSCSILSLHICNDIGHANTRPAFYVLDLLLFFWVHGWVSCFFLFFTLSVLLVNWTVDFSRWLLLVIYMMLLFHSPYTSCLLFFQSYSVSFAIPWTWFLTFFD